MSTIITVEGMTCGHCEQTIEDALREVSGVTNATADREANQASVDGDADVTALVQAVEDAGIYRLRLRTAGTRATERPAVLV